jgi:arginyl-tRNA synthetase
VTLKEVIDEVGADTTKFIFLTRRSDSHLEFDLETAKVQSSENPVFYVQYANARINSIFAHAREKAIPVDDFSYADLNALSLPDELRIIKKLLTYPMVLALSPTNPQNNVYLQELAGMFHPYYNRSKFVTGPRTDRSETCTVRSGKDCTQRRARTNRDNRSGKDVKR